MQRIEGAICDVDMLITTLSLRVQAASLHEPAAGKVKGKQSMFLLYLDAVSVVAEGRNGRGSECHGAGAPCEAVTCATIASMRHQKPHASLRTPAIRSQDLLLGHMMLTLSISAHMWRTKPQSALTVC